MKYYFHDSLCPFVCGANLYERIHVIICSCLTKQCQGKECFLSTIHILTPPPYNSYSLHDHFSVYYVCECQFILYVCVSIYYVCVCVCFHYSFDKHIYINVSQKVVFYFHWLDWIIILRHTS